MQCFCAFKCKHVRSSICRLCLSFGLYFISGSVCDFFSLFSPDMVVIHENYRTHKSRDKCTDIHSSHTTSPTERERGEWEQEGQRPSSKVGGNEPASQQSSRTHQCVFGKYTCKGGWGSWQTNLAKNRASKPQSGEKYDSVFRHYQCCIVS